MFGRGGVGRPMAGELRDSGTSSGTITAFPLCLQVAFQDIPLQGPGMGTDGLSILGFTYVSKLDIYLLVIPTS